MEIDKVKHPFKLCRYVKHPERPYIVFYAWSQKTGKSRRQRVYHPPFAKKGHARSHWRNRAMHYIDRMLQLGYVFTCEPPEQPPVVYLHTPFPTAATVIVKGEPPRNPAQVPTNFYHAVKWAADSRSLEVRPRTGEAYANVCKRMAEYMNDAKLPGLQLSEFNKAHVAMFSDFLFRVRKVSPTTRNNYMMHLRTLFGALLDVGAIKENPFLKFRRSRQDKSTRNAAFSEDQAAKMNAWMAENDPALHFVTRLIYYTFARPIELYRLKVEDVDLDQGLVHFSAAITKSRKAGTSNLPKAAQAMIADHLREGFVGSFFLVGHAGKPTDKMIGEETLNNRHMKALKACGFTGMGFSLYSWKHTGVCAAFDKGMDIMEISNRCRHADVSVTEVYLRDLRRSRRGSDLADW